jgi:hypothetical protein
MNTTGFSLLVFWDEAKKWILSILILMASIYLILNRGTYMWIDNADLVIHEAGHFFFIMFGRFISTMGGTLMQIIIPLLIYSYFHRQGYRTGMQISLLWLGQNFINISVYAADARAQKLPLLGGNKVYHDWNYMLGETGLLNYDAEVGYFFVGLAVITFLISIFMPLIIRD